MIAAAYQVEGDRRGAFCCADSVLLDRAEGIVGICRF